LENKAESNNSNISNNNSNNNRDSRNKTINKVVEESKKSLKSKKDQKRVRSRKGGERKNIYGTDNSKLMFIQTHRDIISSSRSSDNSDHINYLKNSPLKVPGFNRRKNRRSFHALLLRNRNNPILKIGDVSIHFITKILSFICSLPYLFLKSIYSINWNETIRFISEFLSLFKVSSEGRVIVSGEVIFENIENNTKSKDHMKEPKNEQNYSNLNTNSSQKLVNRNNKSSKKIQLFNENNISMKEESSKIEDEIKETEQVNETNESISMPKVASKLSKDINSKLDKKGNLMSEDESLKRKIEIDSKENKEKLTSFPTQISSNEKVKMTPSSPKVDNKNGKNKNKHKNKNKNNGHNLTKEKLTMNSLNIANKIYEKPINITTTITTTTKNNNNNNYDNDNINNDSLSSILSTTMSTSPSLIKNSHIYTGIVKNASDEEKNTNLLLDNISEIKNKKENNKKSINLLNKKNKNRRNSIEKNQKSSPGLKLKVKKKKKKKKKEKKKKKKKKKRKEKLINNEY